MSNRSRILLATLVALLIGVPTIVGGTLYGRSLLNAPVAALTPPPLPTTVDVNGTAWRIRTLPFIGSVNSPIIGYTHCDTRTIDLSELYKKSWHEAVIHETTHSTVCLLADHDFNVNNLYYTTETNEGHEAIYRFAPMWAEILTRNPKLALYLGGPED